MNETAQKLQIELNRSEEVPRYKVIDVFKFETLEMHSPDEPPQGQNYFCLINRSQSKLDLECVFWNGIHFVHAQLLTGPPVPDFYWWAYMDDRGMSEPS